MARATWLEIETAHADNADPKLASPKVIAQTKDGTVHVEASLEEAAAEYRALLAVNPNYPAAYYHGAQTLTKLGRAEEARALYRQGIEAATRIGDLHARSEMEAALSLLG